MNDIFAEACHALVTDGGCNADCCGPIPMRRELVEKHADMVATEYTDTIPEHDEFMFPVTSDLKCIFVDGVTKMCSIHADRPDVCRQFGDESHVQMSCPHLQADGTKRSRQGRRRIERAVTAGQQKLNGVMASERVRLMAN